MYNKNKTYEAYLLYLEKFFKKNQEKINIHYNKPTDCFSIAMNIYNQKTSEDNIIDLLTTIRNNLYCDEYKDNIFICRSNASMIKMLSYNIIKLSPTKEEFNKVYSCILKNFEVENILSIIPLEKEEYINEIMKFHTQSTMMRSSIDFNNILNTLKIVGYEDEYLIPYLTKFKDIVLKNESTGFINEYFKKLSVQDLLFEVIREHAPSSKWINYVEFLPTKKNLIAPTVKKSIFTNEDKSIICFQIDRVSISQQYSRIVIDDGVKKMLDLISNSLQSNKNLFNFENIVHYHSNVTTSFVVTSINEHSVDINKIKDIILFIIEPYCNEEKATQQFVDKLLNYLVLDSKLKLDNVLIKKNKI